MASTRSASVNLLVSLHVCGCLCGRKCIAPKKYSQYVSRYVPEEGDLRTAGGEMRRRSGEQEEVADLARR